LSERARSAHEFGLAQEARAVLGLLAQRRVQELDGHVTADAGVVRLEDRGHAAVSQPLPDEVTPHLPQPGWLLA